MTFQNNKLFFVYTDYRNNETLYKITFHIMKATNTCNIKSEYIQFSLVRFNDIINTKKVILIPSCGKTDVLLWDHKTNSAALTRNYRAIPEKEKNIICVTNKKQWKSMIISTVYLFFFCGHLIFAVFAVGPLSAKII